MAPYNHDLLIARSTFLRQVSYPENIRTAVTYVHTHAIDLDEVLGHVAAWGVVPILPTGKGRFDFVECDEAIPAFIIEPFGADGEMPVNDIIGWQINRPDNVLTYTGEAVAVGEWASYSPASYYGGKPCPVWRTPLGWLQSGCKGLSIINPRKAAPVLLRMAGMGWIAAEDARHARQLIGIAGDAIKSRLVVPTSNERRAA